jgi:diguanylate cyclase (GGDEF)-like protein
MDLEGPERSSAYRRPWYWLLIVAAMAVVAIGAIAFSTRSVVAVNDGAFRSREQVRLHAIEHRLEDYFDDAEQVVRFEAASLSTAHAGDFAVVRWLVRAAFLSRESPGIYGMGVFYVPYALDRHIKYESEYVHAGTRTYEAVDHVLPSGFVEVTQWSNDEGDRYTQYPWFRDALASHEQLAIDGPYTEEGRSFISVLLAFRRNGRQAGVAAVDTLSDQLRSTITAEPGDIVWIEGRKSGTYYFGTAPRPSESLRFVESIPLENRNVRIMMSSDARSVIANDETYETLAAIGILFVIGIAVIVGMVLWDRWSSEERALLMRARQQRLEDEIAVARRIEIELRRAGFTDALTGLPNRAAFLERLAANSGPTAALLIDLDHFNIINETLGHSAGDDLIKTLAERLARQLPGTFVSRLGGDEFGVIVPLTDQTPDEIARRVLSLIAEPVTMHGQTLRTDASIGVVLLDGGGSPEGVLRDADIAVYAAKERGRGRWEIFDAEMRAGVERKSRLEADLRRGIAEGEIIAHYQPIVSVSTLEVVSFEALARWDRPGTGLVSAAEFIPLAEARGLVYELDNVVLREAFAQFAAIAAIYPRATLAVNLSAAELTIPGLVERIEALLSTYGVDARRIRLEITETTMMARSDDVASTLERLKFTGISLVLDDFGTGYSSLAYLQRLPLAGVKIDRSFVEALGSDPRALEIVRSIVGIAGTFGLHVTAEGVESAYQLDVLVQLGVDFAQGYFFSPAVGIAALAALTLPDGAHPASNRSE